jgi:hypothetical protein
VRGMDTLITVGIIIAVSALGSIVIRRLHHKQAGRVAAMHYGGLQPSEDRKTSTGDIRPGQVPSLHGRARRDNRDGGRGRRPRSATPHQPPVTGH